jgi:hypothetical protein
MYFSEKAYGSVLVDVDGDRLELTNLRNTGVVSDHFVLVKDLLPDGGVPAVDAGTTQDAGVPPPADGGASEDGGGDADAGAGAQDGGAGEGGAPGPPLADAGAPSLERAEGAWGCAGAPGGVMVLVGLGLLAAWARRPTSPGGR